MIKHTLNNWPESEREHRLMRETFGPEKLPQNVEEIKPVESKEETKSKGSPEVDRKLDKLEVRGRTNAEAEDLKTKLNVADPSSTDAPKVTPPEPTKKEVLTFTEKMSKAAGDIRKDFVEGSGWTKAGYIAGGVVGFLAARWLWRKTRELFTKSKKEGLIQKTLKWTVGIGAGIAGVVGAKKLKDYWTNPRNILPGVVTEAAKDATDVAKKGAEGAGKGVDSVRTNFDKAFGTKLPQRSEFKSDAEYQKALKDAAIDHMKNGGKLAMLGNTLYFMGLNGVDAVCKLDDVAVAAFNAVIQQNVETTGEFLEVYLEGAVLYVASFGTIDAAFLSLVLGPKAGVVRALKNTAAWPYSIYRKGARIFGIITNTAGRRAAMIEAKAAWSGIGYNFNRMRTREWNPRIEWTEEHLDNLIAEWKKWNAFETELSGYKEAHGAIGHRKGVIAEKIRDALQDLYVRKNYIPDYLQKTEFETLVEQIKAGKVQAGEHFNDKIDALTLPEKSKANANPAPAKAQNSKPIIPDDVDLEPEAEAPVKNKPDASGSKTAEAAETAEKAAAKEGSASDIVTSGKDAPDVHMEIKPRGDSFSAKTEEYLSKLGKKDPVGAAKVRDYVRTHAAAEEQIVAKLESIMGNADIPLSALKDEKVIAVLAEAPVGEIARMGKAAKALTALGMAGDAFSLVVAYWDYQEASRKIEGTNNQELKDLYKDRYKYIAADVVIGTTGLVSGSLAFAGVGATVAAPIAIATLPATAVVGGLYKMHEWKEITSMGSADIAKAEKPEEIIAKLQYKPDGEAIGQMLPWMMRNFDKPNSDEAKVTRAEYSDQKHLNLMRCTALAMNTTTISIPERMRDPDGTIRTPNAEEVKALKEATQVYMSAKIHYLEAHAKGTPTQPFANTDMGILLRDADAHAKKEHDAYVTAKQNGVEYVPQKKPEGMSDREWNIIEERLARDYIESQRVPTMQKLMTDYCMMDEGIRDTILLNSCKALISQKSAPYITAFKAQLLRGDTNFRQNWSDGNISEIVENHVLRLVEGMVNDGADKLSKQISDAANGRSKDTITSLALQPDIYAANVYRLLEKPVTKWWEELKPAEQHTAEQQLQAQEVLQRIAPQMKDLQKKTINSKTHYQFNEPAQIENRMKMWALKLKASENEKILNKQVLTNDADAIGLARLSKGKEAMSKTLSRDHGAFDVNWEWDADHASAAITFGRGNGTLFVMFNPDTLKWECFGGDEMVVGKRLSSFQVNRKDNTESIGSDPAKGIPMAEEKNPSGKQLRAQAAEVLKKLAEINNS